ncbi:OFA family MFS transporter [Ammoniphilus sp. 3BR4]|uniref:L-lactate MFS transporter n=1 Tax=Ammoniphilus sp. 3BR4 TaxID=3158265 RepID=UPI003466366B
MGKLKNRWLVALSAISIHLSIGSAYAYSVFKKPLGNEMGWSGTDIAWAFTIAIFFLGLSAAAFGRFVEKNGPSKSAMVSALFFSTGQIGAGFAVSIESLPLFLVMYGVIGGIGLGIGYISPVSTLVKWFPDRRGLATGMAVFGFGAGSLLASPIAAQLIEAVGISATFYILGLSYFVMMMLGASYIARPPEGWMPEGMKKEIQAGTREYKQDLAQLSANEAFKTKRFWMLWLMIFINISSGIMIISVASPMAQEMVGLNVAAAAAMVGIMGIFNGLGRIGWAGISDYIGRPAVFTAFFAIQIAAFMIIPNVTNALMFQALILVIMTCYGGGFAALPAFIGDMFGTKQLGAIHGYLLTAWSMAGVVGPIAVAQIKEATGSYVVTFHIFTSLLAVALVVSFLIRMDINKKRKQQTEENKVA